MIVGITGCPGAGKTVLSKAVATHGWVLVDADDMGRDVVDTDQDVRDRLADAFGADVIGSDGKLVRPLVAKRAFADAAGTETLNSIVHPALVSRLKSRIETIRTQNKHGVIDCSLIFEWGIEDDLDLVICVHADPETRKKRIMDRDGRSSEEIDGMFRAQLPEDEKIRRAHIAFANDRVPESLSAFGAVVAGLPVLLSDRV